MAKRRIINTKFWSDNYVSNLDPSEKLLFLYFLTNPYTNISGAYEISLKQIALDTGFEKEMVEKIIKRFTRDNKVIYSKGYIIVKNFIKHQEKNPKVQIGIENEVQNLPSEIKNIVYDSLSYLNPNINLNSNTNLKAETSSALIPEVIKLFESINPACKRMYGNKTQRRACQDLLDTYGLEEIKKVVSFLPQNNATPYKPKATTPLQLWEKYQSIKDSWIQEKNIIKSKQRNVLV